MIPLQAHRPGVLWTQYRFLSAVWIRHHP